MKFENEEHEAVFEEICDRMKSCRNTQHLNGYHLAVAYLFALNTSCSEHIDELFDFEEDIIKLDALNAFWQTGTSIKVTRLAFNLWSGLHTDGETYTDEDGDERELPSRCYAVDEIFCCVYAPYFWEAIKLRYPEYTRGA